MTSELKSLAEYADALGDRRKIPRGRVRSTPEQIDAALARARESERLRGEAAPPPSSPEPDPRLPRALDYAAGFGGSFDPSGWP